MPLTVISAPSALPTTQSDYVQQNQLIAASLLDPERIYKIDFENSEIRAGSIINIGGTILKATGTTSIIGTVSDFVQVDVSTYLASYVSSLSGVSWNETYNGYYDGSGNLYLFDELKAFGNLAISSVHFDNSQAVLNGIVHTQEVSFVRINDFDNEAGAVAKSVCGLSGSSLAFYRLGDEKIYHCTIDNGFFNYDSANAYSYGSTFLDMCKIDSVHIAILDLNVEALSLQAFSWGGSSWSTFGSSVSLGSATTARIIRMSSSRYAIYRKYLGSIADIRFYTLSGSTWTLEGTHSLTASDEYYGFTPLSSTEIAFYTSSTETWRKYIWNGSTLSASGNTITLYRTPNQKGVLIDTNIVILSHDNCFFALKYDGTDWSFYLNKYQITEFDAPPTISILEDNIFCAGYGFNIGLATAKGRLAMYKWIDFQ